MMFVAVWRRRLSLSTVWGTGAVQRQRGGAWQATASQVVNAVCSVYGATFIAF